VSRVGVAARRIYLPARDRDFIANQTMKILLNADCSEEKTLENVCALLDCVDVVSVGGTIREDNETTLRQLVRFARDRGKR